MTCSCKEKTVIVAPKAPRALGPYSAAIKVGHFIYCSGQTGLNPATNELVEGGLEAQTHQVLTNLKNVLEAAGTDMAHVIKTTVFLRDMADFQKMNAIYGEYFTDNCPARSTIQVAGLPKNGMVEIELVAYDPDCDCDDDSSEGNNCDCGCGKKG
ncbi:MAG: RidA family protein [Leptolinea sp.]|jgi:2-iminobutanoate/2-iminopropanoate deaminase|nr:RidA family protein [Leptolinea sp.]